MKIKQKEVKQKLLFSWSISLRLLLVHRQRKNQQLRTLSVQLLPLVKKFKTLSYVKTEVTIELIKVYDKCYLMIIWTSNDYIHLVIKLNR